MKKAVILGPTRLPIKLNLAGGGLERSIARIGRQLSRIGYSVLIFGAKGSQVEGCEIYESLDEVQRDTLLAQSTEIGNADFILDSSHYHMLPKLRPDLPILCKVGDTEDIGPRNCITDNSWLLELWGYPQWPIVNEGLDIDDYPFNPNPRKPNYLTWAGGANAPWKHPELVYQVAQKMDLDLWLIGNVEKQEWPKTFYPGPIEPPDFYYILSDSYAYIASVPAFGCLEAAATGTPSLNLIYDGYIADGITGFVREDPTDLAHIALSYLYDIKPKQCRDWVAEYRSIKHTVEAYLFLMEEVREGKSW